MLARTLVAVMAFTRHLGGSLSVIALGLWHALPPESGNGERRNAKSTRPASLSVKQKARPES